MVGIAQLSCHACGISKKKNDEKSVKHFISFFVAIRQKRKEDSFKLCHSPRIFLLLLPP